MFKFRKHVNEANSEATIYKRTIIQRVSRTTHVPQRQVATILDATLDCIQQHLSQGTPVTLIGFGSFYTRNHQEGTVRAVRSGSLLRYPAERRPAFRPGEVLKRAVRRR